MAKVKEVIQEFLEKYGTVVPDNDDCASAELMMDDHICVEFAGVQYYVPKNNSFYTEDDEFTYDILNEMFHV